MGLKRGPQSNMLCILKKGWAILNVFDQLLNALSWCSQQLDVTCWGGISCIFSAVPLKFDVLHHPHIRYDVRNRLDDKAQFGLKSSIPYRMSEEDEEFEEMLDRERYLALECDELRVEEGGYGIEEYISYLRVFFFWSGEGPCRYLTFAGTHTTVICYFITHRRRSREKVTSSEGWHFLPCCWLLLRAWSHTSQEGFFPPDVPPTASWASSHLQCRHRRGRRYFHTTIRAGRTRRTPTGERKRGELCNQFLLTPGVHVTCSPSTSGLATGNWSRALLLHTT